MARQRRSITDIICENFKYLPTKRSRNKRKPIPKESDVKTFNYTAHLRDHKILIASGSRRNVPMQEYMDRGYFTVKETAVNTNHGIQISFTTKITGRGQQWLTRKLLDNGMLKVTGEAA